MCPRDVTPEVVRQLIHRETPGITAALLIGSLNITPMAMASRLTSGIRNRTLIVCFPGSPKACRECFEIVRPALGHCLNQIKGDLAKVAKDHSCMDDCSSRKQSDFPAKGPSHGSGNDARNGVAFRPRHSPCEMVEVSTAWQIIRERILQERSVEEISIKDVKKLLNRVAAQDVISSVNLPPFPAAIKDGYAVIASDGDGERTVLPLPATAGIVPDKVKITPGLFKITPGLFKITPGFCVRISTGAPLPEGADSVIQVEDTELLEATSDGEEKSILLKVKPQPGQDIRPTGCDVEQGECVLEAGSLLGPSQLGILASIGLKKVKVIRPPIIGILSTGDEIVEAGSDQKMGKIWDSNKTLLASLLAKNNFDCVDFGIAKDEHSQVCEKLRKALDSVEVLITTGGVSMGEKDLIKSLAQKEFGAILHFGRVNVKPGKPTTFMTCDWKGSQKIIFGLPGNPVSTHVTFTIFVLPTIRSLSGLDFIVQNQTLEAKLVIPETLTLDSRPELARGIQVRSGLETHVHLVKGSQRSSRLMSTNGADVLVILPPSKPEKTTIENGEIVSIIPFD